MHFGSEVHQAIFRRIHEFVTKNRPVEATLLLSVLVHIVISIKRWKGVAPGGSKFLHQVAGWFLLMSVPSHIYFTRVAGGENLLPAGAEMTVGYVATTSRVFPYMFVPYYATLAAMGAIHTFSGLARAGRILNISMIIKYVPFTGPAFWRTCLGLAVVAASSSLAVSGVYFSYPIAHETAMIEAVLKKLPKSYAKRLNFNNGAWFARQS